MSHTTSPINAQAGKVHFLRLDTLRGIAILLVFLFHYWLAVQQRDIVLAAEAKLSPAWAPWLILHQIGFLGVQLFFVISGFCIHYSYLSWKRRTPDQRDRQFFPRFYARRFWRIVPPYLIALLSFYFVKTAEPFSAQHLKHFAPHLILANTLFYSETWAINPSFWSVAVEWQLYLVYPLALWIFSRLGTARGFLATMAIGLFFRFALDAWNAPFWLTHLPFRWWYEWNLGVLIAASWSEGRRLFNPSIVLGAVLAAIALFAVLGSHDLIFQWLMPPIFFTYLVEVGVWSTRPVSRFAHGLGLIGVCSYSFYLWHQPLVNAAVSFTAHHTSGLNAFEIWIPICAVLLLALIGLSALSYQLTEKPSIALGQWLARRKARSREKSEPILPAGGQAGLAPSALKPD